MFKAFTAGPFTGRHAATILVLFFAVVIAVNFTMARLASTTFGGVVVENSYVASQNYNKWLDQAAREQALGWQARVARQAGGRVSAQILGTGDQPLRIKGEARHPLGRLPDQVLTFVPDAQGGYISQQALPAGRWRVRLDVAGPADRWRSEFDVQ